MRQVLERTEGVIQNLEHQAEQVERKLGEINEKLERLTQSIANFEKQGDEEVENTMQKNLMAKQEEYEREEEELTKLSDELDSIQKELTEAQSNNEESRTEIETLQKIGEDEDIDEAMLEISQRDEIIRMQEQQCRILREKLGGRLTGGSSFYEPRSTPTISERIKWVDVGIKSIATHNLPSPDGISGATDFKKIPMERMATGILRLQEMKPTIESGVGASSDFWSKYDKQRGLDYSNGYQQVYDAFFGGDAIRVTFDGDKYDITNGRHRIWLAKKLGVEYLPMRVTQKVEI